MKKILMNSILLLSAKLVYAKGMPFEIPTYEQFTAPNAGPVNFAIPTPSQEDHADYVRCQQIANQEAIKVMFTEATFGTYLSVAAIKGLTSTPSKNEPVRNSILKYVQIKFQELQLHAIPVALQQKFTELLQDEETLKSLSNNPEEAKKILEDQYRQTIKSAEELAKKSQKEIAAFFDRLSKQQKTEAHTLWIEILQQQLSNSESGSDYYKLLKAELEKAKAKNF